MESAYLSPIKKNKNFLACQDLNLQSEATSTASHIVLQLDAPPFVVGLNTRHKQILWSISPQICDRAVACLGWDVYLNIKSCPDGSKS
jgi:hypothetical protein